MSENPGSGARGVHLARRAALLFGSGGQHLVESAHIRPCAGNDDICAGAMPTEGVHVRLFGLQIDGVFVYSVVSLDADRYFANGIHARRNGFDAEFCQRVRDADDTSNGFIHGIDGAGPHCSIFVKRVSGPCQADRRGSPRVISTSSTWTWLDAGLGRLEHLIDDDGLDVGVG